MDIEKLKEDKKYDEFRLQIIIDSNCNLACEYCVLFYKNKAYKEERSISYNVLDNYISFIGDNYDTLMDYYRRITITFFGGEPLLSKDKCLYLMEKLNKFDNINFVFHTNGVLVDENLIESLKKFNKDRYKFIVSIDGGEKVMLRYRLKNIGQFNKIIKGIELLKENNIEFLFSPSIMKPKANKLFEDYKFLDNFSPSGIIINPVTAVYAEREIESTKQIIKGVRRFLDYLKEEKQMTDREVIDYMGLPLQIKDYKKFLKFGINITGDITGNIHAMSFAWQGFDDGTTYPRDDLETITLGNVIFNKEQLLKTICKHELYKDKKIWEVAYRQQRRRTLPDWDVQNLLAAMILKYFKTFYAKTVNAKR